jgi:hypothetical protein
MTVPAVTVALTDIQTEFGGSNPISLSEYYKGGSYVMAGVTDPNTIPASGQISLSDFRSAYTGPLSVTMVPAGASGSSSTTGVLATNDVKATASDGSGPYVSYAWSKVSGDTVTIDHQGAHTTSFSKNFSSYGTADAVYECTVTDSASATASAQVTVSLECFDPNL